MKEWTRSHWQKVLAIVLSVAMLLGVLPVALLSSAEDDITFAGFASWSLELDGELALGEGVSGNGAQVTLTKDGSTAALYSDPMAVEAGLTYNIGASVKLPAGGYAEVYAAAFSDAAGTRMLGSLKLIGTPAANGDFASVMADFEVPARAVCIRVGVVMGDDAATAGDVYVVDDVYAKPYTLAADLPLTPGNHWYQWDANPYDAVHYAETVESGNLDAGSLHMHVEATKGDVYVAFTPTIPDDAQIGDTYTLTAYVKGDFGYVGSNDGLKWDAGNGKAGGIVLSGSGYENGDTWQKMVAENVVFGGTTLYIVLGQYTNPSDIYLDNITLIDKNGNDVLEGKGTFARESGEAEMSIVNRLSNGDFEDVLYSYLPLEDFNGTFEGLSVSGPQGWELIDNTTGDTLTVGMDEDNKYLLVTKGETAVAGEGTTTLVGPALDVEAGKRYAVSYQIKGDATVITKGVFCDADGNALESWDPQQSTAATADWTATGLAEMRVPANAATFRLHLTVQGAAGAKLCLDNVKLHPFAPYAGEVVTQVMGLVKDSEAGEDEWYYLTGGDYTYTDTCKAEIVDDGATADNPGALHIVHGSTNDADVIVGIKPGALVAGQKYVLTGKWKGSVQTASPNKDGLRLEGYDYDAGTGADRVLFPYTGGQTVSDWTSFTMDYTPGASAAANGFWIMLSRYAGTGEVWLDELKLVKDGDTTGTDLLNGAGNFYETTTTGGDTDNDTDAPATVVTYPTLVGSWAAAGNNEWYQLGDNDAYKHSSDHYGEIVADGSSAANPGSLHLYHKDSNAGDLVVGIKVPGMTSGKTYTVSMKVKGAVGYNDPAGRDGLRVSGYAHENEKVLPITAFTTYTDWTTVTLDYTIGEAAMYSGLWLNLGRYGGTWDVYFDEIKVLDGTTDLLAGAGDFFTETTVTTPPTVTYTVSELGMSNDNWMYGSDVANGTWYKPALYGYSDTQKAEIAETGTSDENPGSLHLYKTVSAGGTDVYVGINTTTDLLKAGSTYTLKMKVKGAVGNGANDGLRVWGGYGADGTITTLTTYDAGETGKLVANTTYTDWTSFSFTYTHAAAQDGRTNEFWFNLPGYSGTYDLYIDEIQLLDANGEDALAGAGDFFTATVSGSSGVTISEFAEVDASNPASITMPAKNTWYTIIGTENLAGWTGLVFDKTAGRYAEIVEMGSSDENPGSLHMVHKDSTVGDLTLGIAPAGLEVGKTYTVSMKVKGSVGYSGDNVNGLRVDGFGVGVLCNDPVKLVPLTGGTQYNWDTFTVTFTASQNEVDYGLWFRLSTYSHASEVWLDEVKVLDGTTDLLAGAGNFFVDNTAGNTPDEPVVDDSSWVADVTTDLFPHGDLQNMGILSIPGWVITGTAGVDQMTGYITLANGSSMQSLRYNVTPGETYGLTASGNNISLSVTFSDGTAKTISNLSDMAYIQAPEDAEWLRVRVSATDAGAYVDTVSCSVPDESEDPNLDFEYFTGHDSYQNMPLNWTGSSTGSMTITANTEKFYRGEKSLQISRRNGEASYSHIESIIPIPVEAGDDIELVVHMSSKNAVSGNVAAYFQYVDKNGKALSGMVGQERALNTTGEWSEWSEYRLTHTVPNNAVGVTLLLRVGGSSADVLFDSLEFYNYTANDNTIYLENFAGPSSDGMFGGWNVGETAGQPTFETAGAAGITGGAADNASIYTDLYTFKTDYIYNVTANAVSTGTATGKLIIQALDWRDRVIQTVVEQDIAGVQTIVSDFTAPSATAYRVTIQKTGGEGTISVNDVTIKQISDPVGNVDWAGAWLAHYAEVDNMMLSPHPFVDRHYYFRQEINLESEVVSAQMQITADDKFTLYVNGEMVYKEESIGQSWDLPVTLDLSDYMTKGKNVIAVDMYNDIYGYGLLFDGIVKMENDTSMRFYSTGNMLVARGTVGWSNDPTQTVRQNPDFTDDDIATFMAMDYVTDGHPAWSNAIEYARAGGGLWGPLAFDPTEYSDYKLESNEFTFTDDVLVAGEVIDVTAQIKIEEALPTSTSFKLNFLKRNSTKQVSTGTLTLADGKTTDSWPIGEEFTAKFEMRVPDFLPNGRYTVQFDKTIAIISDYFINNKVGDIELVQPERELTTTSEIKVNNGKPTLYVNGQAKAPIWHSPQERETAFNADTVALFGESGLDTIVSYVLMRSAAEDMYRPDGSIDVDAIDSMILKALTANPDAQMMMHIDTSPPDWWLEANPDECVLLDNGTRSKEAFYSEKWRKDIGDYVVKVIDHIMAQPYANNVIGIKIVGGSTYEWQWWGITEGNGAVGDFSTVGTNAYREWLKKTYGTNEAMQAAYKDNTITFENALAPSREVRNESEYGTVLHLQDSRRLVDYETFMSETKTDAILYFTELCKEAVDNRLVVGTYAGYVVNGGSYEFTAGTANVFFQRLLEADSLDFIKCPWSYGLSREVGYMTDYMGPVDSATLHGKLYVAEDDDRLNLHELSMAQDSRASVGWTRTTKQSVETIKRNTAYALSKGQAITYYNLASTSYFHDEQFYGLIGELLQEGNLSVGIEHETVADIAVYVDGESLMTLPRLPDATGGAVDFSNEIFAQSLIRNQQMELFKIGAPYDLYLLDDLADGLVPDHKIHVMWQTNWIDEAERKAIEERLMKDGNIIVWIFTAGIVDGETTDIANIEELAGIDLEVASADRKLFGSVTIGGDADTTGTTQSHWLTEGLFGQSYGTTATSVLAPVITVIDSDATPLGVHSLSDSTAAGEVGLAVKEIATADGGSYTSVYSAVPALPQKMFRNMLKHVGGHIYDDNASDVIFASENYVTVHTLYAGERTIKLPGNYAVYDVYNQEVYAANTDEIVYTAYDMETRLFRLSEPDTIQNYVGQTAGGKVSPAGISNLKAGDDLTVTFTPDDGYRLNYIVVDGEKIVPEGNTYTFADISKSHTLMAYFAKVYERPVIDKPVTDDPADDPVDDPTDDPVADTPVVDTPPAEQPDEETPLEPAPQEPSTDTIIDYYEETFTTINWPAVIGLIAGVVAGLGVLIFLIIFLVKRKKKKDEEAAAAPAE